MNNYNTANNSIKNSNASNNSYDFYSKFGTTTTLTKEYFTKSLKAETKLTKIRIDSLPLHSALNLDNNPIQVAQEINFDDVTKITFKSSIDEYDQFSWSGYVNSGYFPSVTMKVGVGTSYFFIDVTTPFNTPYLSNNSEFESTINGSNISISDGMAGSVIYVYGGVQISSLPTSGVITYNNGIPINAFQKLTPSELNSLVYTPNLNYIGTDQFLFALCMPQSVIDSTPVCELPYGFYNIITEVGTQTLNGGGTIVITNDQPSSPQPTTSSSSESSSSSSLSLISQNSIIPEPTATTKIFDPNKLSTGKKKPSFGVLSSADDKAAIEDPYVCAGDIYGAVEYSGNYNNIDVKVKIEGKSNYKLPVEFDRNNGSYVAKVDYNLVIEGDYNINYKVISKLTNKTLDEGNYKAFITQNCGPKKEILVVQQVKKAELPVVELEEGVALARTGGYLNLVNLPLIAIILLVILGCIPTLVFGDSEK